MTTREMIYSLTESTECPACGKKKHRRMSLCSGCYYSLPQKMRSDLYQLVGEGYEQALSAALKRLGAADCEWEQLVESAPASRGGEGGE